MGLVVSGHTLGHTYTSEIGEDFLYLHGSHLYPVPNANSLRYARIRRGWTSFLRILSNLSESLNRKHACRVGWPSVTLCPLQVAMELTLTANFMLLIWLHMVFSSQKHYTQSYSGSLWRYISTYGSRAWENCKVETRNGLPVASLDSIPTFPPSLSPRTLEFCLSKNCSVVFYYMTQKKKKSHSLQDVVNQCLLFTDSRL